MLAEFLTTRSDKTLDRIEHVASLVVLATMLLITPVAIVVGIFGSMLAAGSVLLVGCLSFTGMIALLSEFASVRRTYEKPVLYVVMKS